MRCVTPGALRLTCHRASGIAGGLFHVSAEMFVINLLPLLLGFLGPSAESPCLPINQGLLDSNISNVFCKYNGLESASAIAEGTSCSVQCRLKNLEKLFHCWKSGWNEVPHVSILFFKNMAFVHTILKDSLKTSTYTDARRLCICGSMSCCH